MTDTIVVAIISGLCVAIPSLIATYSTTKRNASLMSYQLGELSKQMTALEKKVDGIWERVLRLEGRVDKVESEIENDREVRS